MDVTLGLAFMGLVATYVWGRLVRTPWQDTFAKADDPKGGIVYDNDSTSGEA